MARNKGGQIAIDYNTDLILAVIAGVVALVLLIAFKDGIMTALRDFIDWIRYSW